MSKKKNGNLIYSYETVLLKDNMHIQTFLKRVIRVLFEKQMIRIIKFNNWW